MRDSSGILNKKVGLIVLGFVVGAIIIGTQIVLRYLDPYLHYPLLDDVEFYKYYLITYIDIMLALGIGAAQAYNYKYSGLRDFSNILVIVLLVRFIWIIVLGVIDVLDCNGSTPSGYCVMELIYWYALQGAALVAWSIVSVMQFDEARAIEEYPERDRIELMR